MTKNIAAFRAGKPAPNDFNSESEDDDEYEDNCGEYALYDSPLEKTDELMFLKQTLEGIHNSDQNTY